MIHRILTCLIGLMAILSATDPMLAAQPPSQPVAIASAAVPTEAAVSKALHLSPILFIENVGQWDAAARFQVRGGASTMWLSENAIWLTVVEQSADEAGGSAAGPSARFGLDRGKVERENKPRKAVNIQLSFVGANRHPRVEPFRRLETTVSYFVGNDPMKWQPDVPVWGGVRYVDLYPGMDLEITSEGGRIVQRLAARPGADVAAVQLRVEGADAVAVDEDALRLETDAGEFALPLLSVDGSQAGGLKVKPRGTRIFDVAAPFARANSDAPSNMSESAGHVVPEGRSPVANPQSVADSPGDLLYGTFLGGSNIEYGQGIDLDGTGHAYVMGYTLSSEFPTTPGASDTSSSGSADIFVVKLNSTLSGLAYATFIGGSDSDEGHSIAVDGAGSAFVTGSTVSTDFPTTAGAYDSSVNGDSYNAFVVKLAAAGSALAYGTYLGSDTGGWGVEVGGEGSAYVTGNTSSSDFPTTVGAFDTSYNGGYEAWVVKLNPAGSALAYATFLGGNGDDSGSNITVDATGDAFVTGSTDSADFPVTLGAFDTSYNGARDVFVVRLDSTGDALDYATFLGGEANDYGGLIALDAAGSAYVMGQTVSGDFPVTPGAFDGILGGDSDCYVAKLDPTGSELAYATYLGGSSSDGGSGIAVDGAGRAFLTGGTGSSDFPTTPGAFDSYYHGGEDIFIARLAPAGNELEYATFLGGSGCSSEASLGIALDDTNSVYVTGFTESTDFPTTPGAFDTSFDGYIDAFVIKLAMGSGETADAISLVYDGARFLHGTSIEVIDEPDGRLTTGDHVHLRLPFTNNGGTTIPDATFEVWGDSYWTGSYSVSLVSLYDGGVWHSLSEHASLSLGTIGPGETRYRDFWIYVTDIDPTLRQSLPSASCWLNVRTLTGIWRIHISLSPIDFATTVIGHDDLESGSCLHHPDNISIQRYAQYAAGACVKDNRGEALAECKPRAIRNCSPLG